MKVYQSTRDLFSDKATKEGPFYSFTIGNFDGVHLGHRHLLKEFVKAAHAEKSLAVLVTFTPHPLKIFNPAIAHFLLSPLEEKRKLLEDLNLDAILEIPFNRDFSLLSPEDFLQQTLLFAPEKVKEIHLGDDFLFGNNRRGDIHLLRQMSKKLNPQIKVVEFSEFSLEGKRITSTLLRDLIKKGELAHVPRYLGRPYSLSSLVIKERGRGRTIGFPTANLSLHEDWLVPSRGVYISETRRKEKIYQSVTNVGITPTFEERLKITIETHLLDFDDDLYGEKIEVSFLKKLRGEIKFNSVDELVEQIQKDVLSCRDYFKAL